MSALPDDPSVASAFEILSADLQREFLAWHGEAWTDEKFDATARRLFEFQFETCEPYRRYCLARDVVPEGITDWREIPPVPTEAFRHVEFRCASRETELRFRTSGTTGAGELRGVHIVPDPDLYRASLRSTFLQLALGGSASPPPLLISLVPPFDPDGGSSLAWMIDDLTTAFGGSGSRSVGSSSGIDWNSLAELCAAAVMGETTEREEGGGGVCLLGTTLAFAAFLDFLEAEDSRYDLPAGSLIMDTGGAKGREGLKRDEMLSCLAPRLGLADSRIVNEFGMTELLSQRYARSSGHQPLLGPPWLRTLVLDPVSLQPRRDGEEGILCHYDLANAGSVIGVLTSDRGRCEGEGFVMLGRTPGAPPRGCSLATAELLRARGNAS